MLRGTKHSPRRSQSQHGSPLSFLVASLFIEFRLPMTLQSKIKQAIRGTTGFIQNQSEQRFRISSSKAISIGNSLENRPIYAYKIGTGSKVILAVGGIHGNEVGSVYLANKLLSWAEESALDITLYIVPCLNPDGFRKAQENPDYFGGGKVGRFNTGNVDLNRNFDTPSFCTESQWGTGKNYQEKTNVYCGDKPFSEPETKAFRDFVDNRKPDLVIMLHNAGAAVLANPVGSAKDLAKIFSEKTTYKIETYEFWKTLGQTGTAIEWLTGKNIPCLEIEGKYRWSSDWKRVRPAFQRIFESI